MNTDSLIRNLEEVLSDGRPLNRSALAMARPLLPERHATVDHRPLAELLLPGERPKLAGEDCPPALSVGVLSHGGPVVVGVTELRKAVHPYCVPTFFSLTAWVDCCLHSPFGLPAAAIFAAVDLALRDAPVFPSNLLHVLVGGSGLHLHASYGAAPWGPGACLVLSTVAEPNWAARRFQLGDVVLETHCLLDPDQLFGVLGRHVGGDWGDEPFGEENDLALLQGSPLTSYYELPSVGESFVTVTTNADRSETRIVHGP